MANWFTDKIIPKQTVRQQSEQDQIGLVHSISLFFFVKLLLISNTENGIHRYCNMLVHSVI